MCSYLLLKGDKGDTHPHFGFNLKKEPEMNFCSITMLVWFGY